MPSCNHCGGHVRREEKTGPYAINDDETTEYRFECENCGESADVLLMDGVGWEPSLLVDLDDSDAPGVEA